MSPVSAFCLAQCQDSCNKWQPEWSLPLVTVTEGENNRHFLSLLVFKMKFDILHQSKKKSKSAPLFPHSRSLTKSCVIRVSYKVTPQARHTAVALCPSPLQPPQCSPYWKKLSHNWHGMSHCTTNPVVTHSCTWPLLSILCISFV